MALNGDSFMRTKSWQMPKAVMIAMIVATVSGCERKKTERDIHSESKMAFGSKEWNDAAAEDIRVRTVSVLLRPDSELTWTNERAMLQLTADEKENVMRSGVTGQLEAVHTAVRGSGSTEVRIVIIQRSPLKENAQINIPVPKTGSVIYIQDDGGLRPLFTNSPPSALTLEVFQEKRETATFMNYPRDRTRYGGAIFWWDEKGNWHEL